VPADAHAGLPGDIAPSDRWIWIVAVLGVTAALMVPLVIAEVPPLQDYPNHIARMFVLAHGDADPFLSRVYGRHWPVIPNIAIDAVMPPMLAVIPIHIAGRIVVAIAAVLPVLGTVFYGRALLGRYTLWSLVSAMMAYNLLLLAGFLNFQIAAGLALLAAAFWIRVRPTHPLRAVLVLMVSALLIAFAHAFGALFLGLLLLAHELVATWRDRHEGAALWRRAAAGIGLMTLILAGPAILLAISAVPELHGVTLTAYRYWKVVWAFAPLLNYHLALDLGTAGVLMLVVLGCVLARKADVSMEAFIAVAVLAVLYVFVPNIAMATSYLDTRLAVLAGFPAVAGFAPRVLSRRVGWAIGLVLAGLFVIRMAVICQAWTQQNSDVAQLRQVMSHVPAGSRVLVVEVNEHDNPGYWKDMAIHRTTSGHLSTYTHLPALLIIERDAMWPLLFTDRAKQPVFVRPEFADLTQEQGMLPSYRTLLTDTPAAQFLSLYSYMVNWPDKFDFVLLLLAEGAPDLASLRPDRLAMVDKTAFASLFRITRGPAIPGSR